MPSVSDDCPLSLPVVPHRTIKTGVMIAACLHELVLNMCTSIFGTECTILIFGVFLQHMSVFRKSLQRFPGASEVFSVRRKTNKVTFSPTSQFGYPSKGNSEFDVLMFSLFLPYHQCPAPPQPHPMPGPGVGVV